MRKIGLLIYISVLSQVLWSQVYQAVDRFTDEDGLSNAVVTSLLQDHHGYLWIGTKDGLNRFDGYTFQHFSSNLADTTSIKGSVVLDLLEDNAGGLWCLTDIALNYKAPRSGTFYSYLFYDKDTQTPIELYAFDLDWRRNRLIVLSNKGIYELNPDTRVSRLISEVKPKGGKNRTYWKSVVFSPHHNSFFIYSDSEILHYTTVADTLRNLKIKQIADIKAEGGIAGLICDEEGQLWLHSSKSLWKLEEGKLLRKDLPGMSRGEMIVTIIADGIGGFELLTTRARYQLNSKGGLIACRCNYSANFSRSEFINSYLRIPEGVFWLGTNRGLYQYNEHGHKFNYFEVVRYFPDAGEIKSFAYDQDGGLWVHSTRNELLYTQALKSLQAPRIKPRISLQEIVTDANSTGAILGVSDKGVFRYTLQAGRISEQMLFKGAVQKVVATGTDTLWVVQNARLINVATKESYTIPKQYGGEVLDANYHQGQLFILMRYRIVAFNPGKKAFVSYSLNKLKLSVLPANRCFAPLSENELVVGTTNGVYIYYTNGDEIVPSYIDNLYLQKPISAIYPETENKLWIALGTGIFLYDRSMGVVHPFDRYEGLVPVFYESRYMAASPAGNLCFAGKDMAVVFHPDSVSISAGKRRPDIVQVSYIEKQQTVTRKLYGDDSLTIVSSSSWLGFDCAVLDYRSPQKNYYQYSLVPDGETDRWVNIGTERTFYESLMSSGYYRLKVRTLDQKMQWASESREIVIRVISPFWRTRIAIASYVILFILFFYLSIFFTTRNLRRRNREYKERERIARKVEQQKEELSLKNKNITDSINYAKRIQMALMPPRKFFSDSFPDSFILHMPKDIVSGDFYWVNEVDGRTFFAAVDCTGHGVPGAFMSIIGFELFRRITEQEKKKHPADILNSLSQGFESIFRDIDKFTLRDGMDVALCVVDKDKKVLEFAGAFNPLYLVRNNTISEIKGDRFSVGLSQVDDGMPPQEFKGHRIDLKDGDILYIFTDGYADQFGGPEGKKYKYRRFRHLLLALHQLPMQRQVEFLRRSIMDWKGGLEQVDDILVMGVRISKES